MPDPSLHAPSALMAAQAAQASAEDSADAVKVSERRYRRLFEAAHDGILILDSQTGTILDANPFMAELLGYSHEEFLGKELWEIGLLRDKDASQEAFQQLQRDGSIRYEDLPLKNRNGTRREVEFVSNLYREGGHTVAQCNIRDITERKAAEKELAAVAASNERVALALQRPLLLEVPEDAFKGLSVATLYSSAWAKRGEAVGGDFFDAFPLADGRVALVLGDASGKGLTAAARATEVKDVLRAFLRIYPYYPAQTLSRLNDYLCDTQSLDHRSADHFMALALAVVNLRRSEAVFAWGGIEPPLMVRAGGDVEVVQGGGLPLGVSAQEVYAETTLPFRKGDTLVMNTDGLSEARSEETKEFLGLEGVVELVQAARMEPSLKAMSEAMVGRAKAFAGGQLSDDACLVLARRK